MNQPLHRVFPCNQCGLCCENVNLAEETRFLDRGDGTCKYHNATTKTCSIYTERPDICRVDRMYDLRYSHQYTWDEFINLNLQVCDSLKLQSYQDRWLIDIKIAKSSAS